MGFKDLSDVGPEDSQEFLPQEILSDLSVEASQWYNAILEVYDLRDDVTRSFSQESPKVTELSFDALLNGCAKYLNRIGITKTLPTPVVQERKEYRDLIIKSIDRDREKSYASGLDMLRHMEEIVTSVLDHAQAPILGYRVLKSFADKETVRKEQKDGIKIVSDYCISFEKNRDIRRLFLKTLGRWRREPIDKIAGYGDRNPNFPISELIYNLHEPMQPKLQHIGRSKEEVEEVQEEIREKLTDFVDVRRKLRKKRYHGARVYSTVRKILLDDPDVLEMIVGEIKPRTPYDLISGHPLQRKLRELMREDEELSKRRDALLELYMIVFPGRHCSQSVVYDILYDIAYGKPEEVFWVFNLYHTAWGYPPLPGFENIPAEKVVDTRSSFRLYKLLPRLERYDVYEPPKGMIV